MGEVVDLFTKKVVREHPDFQCLSCQHMFSFEELWATETMLAETACYYCPGCHQELGCFDCGDLYLDNTYVTILDAERLSSNYEIVVNPERET